ncbi:uncharacterized protein LOC130447796 [Diorhabda sublineata]|uniref:uncharacterized protein LOC130447796 n=1 Tax=Diorhabda sublineata TaxID=1163346 RepID=UPI0024E15E2A|nr:uncharacterized protein LOC130447796 [Diorhabda sublineata]
MDKEFGLLLILPIVVCVQVTNHPVYKFRYETEDLMKTAASNLPVRGYHVVEGGYYPQIGAAGGGFGFAGSPLGNQAFSGQFLGPNVALGQAVPLGTTFGGQIIPQYIHGGVGTLGGLYGGLQHHPHHIGGEEIIKGQFSSGKKNANDEKFEKSEGRKGDELNHNKAGFAKGEVLVKDFKGDSGRYNNVNGEKKVYEDGKEYQGGQHYNKEGKSGEEKTAKQGHKKGHKVKSFKNSHHKDETGKSEEYYDESHDEGGNYVFNGQSGSFGEQGASGFKGGHHDSKYNQAEAKKEGQFENKHSVEKVEGDQGKYGENKFAGNQALFGYKTGADEQSLLGHEESSKFVKSHPLVVPFYQP